MPSSKDVAKKAGVSQTTVSRVLNTPDKVKEATREKVLRAIEALNYVPDANARSLVQKRTGTITLISGPLHNPFFVDSTEEIVRFANRAGYRVNVHFASSAQVDVAYAAAFGNKCDGIILSCLLLDDPVVARLQALDIPSISFNRRHRHAGNFVEIDNVTAGRLAVTHLLDLGHRDIFWVGAAPIVSTFHDRFAGFRQVVSGAKNGVVPGLKIRNINFKQLDKPDIPGLLRHLARSNSLPGAFCAATDAIAIDLMDALSGLGLSVPEDVSVIGIDNVKLSGNGLIRLTTVGCAKASVLGLTAIRKLIALIESGGRSGDIRITEPVILFERNSTRTANVPAG
ncbi:LacI family DNA-binding transcriptional regulator [uncultured Cardiobacterium sp.]|uniref:LacI family DNA-binding transcriptional regulator n=1 Tax=uncultured Cardiobacterium sp. TaxID=417619 RepID=UPI0026356F9C|nr:LacI family DNA-binding transcriptional regulator [uncultured Cardiobacterium sp.]